MGEAEYVYAGWLIDGSGGNIQTGVLLEIEDGVIVEIASCTQEQSPENCIDLSHCTILPPLIDSHVHLSMSGSIDSRVREEQLHTDYVKVRPVISQHLSDHLSHGVFAIRDGGDRNGYVARYRQNDLQGKETGIIISEAGRAWHKKGRYGGLIGRSPVIGSSLADAYAKDTEEQEYVKLVNSGLNSLLEFGRKTAPQFTEQEIAAIVVKAEGDGKKVMVHANGNEPVRLALEAGCHSIEHGFFMGEANLKRMADKGVFWVPTVFTMKAYADHLDKDKQDSKAVCLKNLKHQMGQIRTAHKLGVPLALGTDSGSMGVLHGESMVEEMKLYIKAGLTLSETVQCATWNGARLLGIEDKMGLLQKNRPASFLVARGTPAQLPRKLSYLEAIYVGGKLSEGYRKNRGNYGHTPHLRYLARSVKRSVS